MNDYCMPNMGFDEGDAEFPKLGEGSIITMDNGEASQQSATYYVAGVPMNNFENSDNQMDEPFDIYMKGI